jgi:hypothetical protein
MICGGFAVRRPEMTKAADSCLESAAFLDAGARLDRRYSKLTTLI